MRLPGLRLESVLRQIGQWSVDGFVEFLVHWFDGSNFGDGVDFALDNAALQFPRGLLHAGAPDGAGGDVVKRGDGFVCLFYPALGKQRLVRAPNGAVLGEDEDS